MNKRAHRLHTALLMLLSFLGGAGLVLLLQRRKSDRNFGKLSGQFDQHKLTQPEPAPTDVEKLAPKPELAPVPVPTTPTPVKPPKEKKPRRWLNVLLLILALLLAAVGPVLVMLERWFQIPAFEYTLRHQWCELSLFLCSTALRSYFLIIIPCFLLALILLFWLNKRQTIPFLTNIQSPQNAPAPALPDWQSTTARILETTAVATAAAVFLLAVLQDRPPGIEFPFIVIAYLLSVVLKAIDFSSLRTLPQKLPAWLAPFLFNHLSLILFMRALSGHLEAALASGLLLGLSLILLWPHRRQLPLVLWILNLAVFLYTFLLQSWRTGIIGDEYIFYHYGRIVLNEHDLQHILNHLFNARTVIYGKFLYFSVLPHAVFMRLFGDDNFGWRFANIYLAVLAIPFFYAFAKTFCKRRTALVYAFLFAVSQYLICFSRIGYNNVQSLLGMAVILWLAAKAISSGKDLHYSLLGMALGLCLYIYPAVLAVLPLPILLLFFYNPPWRSRRSLSQWILIIAGFSLLFLPLLFEPDYWQQKMNESALETVGIPHYYHLFSNLLYSLFSFLYAPEESHYIVSSYIDPLSGLLVTLGLGWALWRARREKFMRFMLLGLLLLFFNLGASRSRALPSVTHMFLILPWWFLFASLGIEWLVQLMKKRRAKSFIKHALLVLLVLISGMNLVHAFYISPIRSDRYHSMEALHMRFVQDQNGRDGLGNQGQFLFITDEKWNIYGFNSFRDAYHLPRSQTQLVRVSLYTEPFYPIEERIVLPQSPIINEEECLTHLEMETWALELAAQPDTVVIVQPWLTEHEHQSIAMLLETTSKQPCPIKPTPLKDASFIIWLDPTRMEACPLDGIWSGFW